MGCGDLRGGGAGEMGVCWVRCIEAGRGGVCVVCENLAPCAPFSDKTLGSPYFFFSF